MNLQDKLVEAYIKKYQETLWDDKVIDKEKLPKSIQKYYWLIQDFEKSYEREDDNDWWCYLMPSFETDDQTITIHDTLSMIRSELKDLAIKYQKFNPNKK